MFRGQVGFANLPSKRITLYPKTVLYQFRTRTHELAVGGHPDSALQPIEAPRVLCPELALCRLGQSGGEPLECLDPALVG